MIDSLVEILQKNDVSMVTLRQKNRNLKCPNDKNIVKIVIDCEENALYFSRSPIPFSPSSYFWHHIGVYGFQKDLLIKYKNMPVSFLEKSENLEQLRVLENGYKIKTIETQYPTLSINVPDDITEIEKLMIK
jgi:3-deoxy-manno-octulosonate cytidylyltransferase (CMP-KDO synthetase)